jgi:hypothetical protein
LHKEAEDQLLLMLGIQQEWFHSTVKRLGFAIPSNQPYETEGRK